MTDHRSTSLCIICKENYNRGCKNVNFTFKVQTYRGTHEIVDKQTYKMLKGVYRPFSEPVEDQEKPSIQPKSLTAAVQIEAVKSEVRHAGDDASGEGALLVP